MTTILEPHEIHPALVLGDNLEILNIYLKLYASELQIHLQGKAPMPQDLIAFVITNSPYPGVWIKKSQMTDQEAVRVQIISSPSVNYRTVSEVRATIITNTTATSKVCFHT